MNRPLNFPPDFDDDNELVVDGPTRYPVDRRDFLKLTSTGLLILVAVDPARGLQEGDRGRPGPPADVNAYLHIAADSRVTCFVGKVELGQGAMTSLPQLLAEELDVALSSVDVVMGDTDLCPWDMGTFGSLSIRAFGPVLRNAGAEARALLLKMASERLQAPVDRLVVQAGVVSVTGEPSKKVSYGQLTAGQRIVRTVEVPATVKPVRSFTIVGTSAPRRDALEKVTGRAKYAGDIVPQGGALHARILRPPAHGATLAEVDVSAAEKLPGVRVVRDGDTVAVLHEHRDEADRALALVKARFERHDPPVDDRNIFDHLVRNAPPGEEAASGGDVKAEVAAGSQVFEETWLDTYTAHAPMETHSAVAAVADGKVTVWAGTQTPFPVKSQIMQALHLPEDKVRVITPYVGGGFGGKSASRQAIEAARLATLVGRPVRVVMSREEEFFYDTFGPAAVMKIRSAIDGSGNIQLWDYRVYAAGDRGAAHFYDIPNHRTMVHGGWRGGPPGYHPFGVGPWRAPGANTNAFGRESHIDVMAAKVGLDPVAFRLRNLKDPRMIRVLNAAARKFGWTPGPAPSGRGVGVALGIDAAAYVALMAQVAVDRATGRVQVERVVCAQDQGVIVNPEGSLQQVEGCITMGLGYTLSEEVHFKGGEILDTNFDTYELPRFSRVPRIETVFIDAPDIPAAGCGEPAIVPMGAVVANAIFDAVGTRLHQMPMTPARVKEALALAHG